MKKIDGLNLILKTKLEFPNEMNVFVALKNPSIHHDSVLDKYNYKYKVLLSFDDKNYKEFDFFGSIYDYDNNRIFNKPSDVYDMVDCFLGEYLDYKDGLKQFMFNFDGGVGNVGIFKSIGEASSKIEFLNKDTNYDISDLFNYFRDTSNGELEEKFIELEKSDITINEDRTETEIIDYSFESSVMKFYGYDGFYENLTNEYRAEKVTDIYELKSAFDSYEIFSNINSSAIDKINALENLIKNIEYSIHLFDIESNFITNRIEKIIDTSVITIEDKTEIDKFFLNVASYLKNECEVDIFSDNCEDDYCAFRDKVFSFNEPKAFFLSSEPIKENIQKIAKEHKDVHILNLTQAENKKKREPLVDIYIAIVKDETKIKELQDAVEILEGYKPKYQNQNEVEALNNLVQKFDESNTQNDIVEIDVKKQKTSKNR